MAGRVVHAALDDESVSSQTIGELSIASLYSLSGEKSLIFAFPSGSAVIALYPGRDGRCMRSVAFCRWASLMRSQGIAVLRVTGQAHRLAYLELSGGELTIAHCENIRFSPPSHFASILASSPDDGYMAIGEAGEKASPLASCRTDSCISLGRGGLATSMGRMNFKGIVAHGTVESAQTLPRLPERSALVRDMTTYGNATLASFGLRHGWLATKHCNGKFDPRAAFLDGKMEMRLYSAQHSGCPDCRLSCRLEEKDGSAHLPSWLEAMALGSNLGIWGMEKVKRLADKCALCGLDPVETGEALSALKAAEALPYTYPVVEGASLDELEKTIALIASRKLSGEIVSQGLETIPGALTVAGRAACYDLRGAHAQALFTALGEDTPCFIDLVKNLKSTLDEETVGRAAAWARVLTHALENRGVPAFYMLPLHFERLPLVKRLWRLVFSTFSLPGVKSAALLKEGLESVRAYDEERGNMDSLPERFSFPGSVGYTDEVGMTRLAEGYRAEIRRLAVKVSG